MPNQTRATESDEVGLGPRAPGCLSESTSTELDPEFLMELATPGAVVEDLVARTEVEKREQTGDEGGAAHFGG